MPDTSTLRATLLFADVAEDHLTTIADAATERSLRRGDVLFTEGEEPDQIYIVTSGRIVPDAALRYPPRNVYIAERFELKAGSETRLEAAKKAGVVPPDATTPPPAPLVTPPEIVHECALMRLWHRADDKFDQPRMSAYFHVSLPGIEDSPDAFVAADMLTLMIHDQLQDRVRYPAELASLNAGLDVVGQHTGLSLTFDGFDCKLPRLVRAYFGAARNGSDGIRS